MLQELTKEQVIETWNLNKETIFIYNLFNKYNTQIKILFCDEDGFVRKIRGNTHTLSIPNIQQIDYCYWRESPGIYLVVLDEPEIKVKPGQVWEAKDGERFVVIRVNADHRGDLYFLSPVSENRLFFASWLIQRTAAELAKLFKEDGATLTNFYVTTIGPDEEIVETRRHNMKQIGEYVYRNTDLDRRD